MFVPREGERSCRCGLPLGKPAAVRGSAGRRIVGIACLQHRSEAEMV